MRNLLRLTAATIALLPVAARADEGMWTFDAFPAAKMRAAYGFAPDQAWLDRVRGAAVRLTGGCSASFVSGEGLILTNHHCVVGCLQALTDADHARFAEGYRAQSRAEERKCPGQQGEVVTAISDVSADVTGAIGALTAGEAIKARDAKIAAIESAGCTDRALTRCQVVTLYGGAQYKLYRYRKYSDMRIVWSPEYDVGQFGGDPDNFNFPRYGLDASFLRAYENGKPAVTPAHLTWAPRAPVDGEAVFIAGNPGSTQRLQTLSQIAFEREVRVPLSLTTLSELRGRMISAMESDPAKARDGAETLFGIENSLKVTIGRMSALTDPILSRKLAAAEADLKAKSGTANGDPWGDVDRAVSAYRPIYMARRFAVPQSTLLGDALALVRAADERSKPNGERLRGYRDAELPLLEKQLTDPEPVYPWLDQLQLEFGLSKAREYLGADDPQTRLLLGKQSPENLAAALVSGTKLGDAAVRKALWDGGKAAVDASIDPMIVYARKLDANDRALTKHIDALYAGPIADAGRRLARARFAAYGDTQYPDATFTLRLTYGKVQSWTERGKLQPTRTTFGGMFDRATGDAPYKLPPIITAALPQVDKTATLDFITTADVIGGNSGSPVIDRKGQVIGALFDGNIHSLAGNYGYDDTANRSIAVSTAAVEEAIRHIYPAPALLAELHRK